MSTFRRLSPRAGHVIIIAVCWALVLVLDYVNTYLLIGDLTRLGKLQGDYPFLPDFAATAVLGLFGGLVGGYLLVYRVNSGRRHTSFMSDIIRSGVLFILIYLGAAVVILFTLAFAYNAFQTDAVSAFRAGWRNVGVNLYTPSFLVSMLVWGLFASGTQFMLQVNDKFGPGVLWKLITGKYYQPREEERIFMFLDLQSSTTIAERLGHRRFFEFLRELYQDVTSPITACGGEIYQYVGDEVVITWPPKRGLEDENCVRCFFEIEQAMDARRMHYEKRFGVVPMFKAGVHVGPATVGEIGVVKKDIVFTGDVLNTTARIQGECNRHRVNLIVSSDLLQRMRIEDAFHAVPIGEIALRGKAEPLALSVVLPA
jgi:adenylate cyclase